MGDEQILFAEARLGLDVDTFMASDAGRYLVGRADLEAEKALDALAHVSPTDTVEIQRLQNEVYRARSFRQWMEEVIEAGRLAEDVMREQEI